MSDIKITSEMRKALQVFAAMGGRASAASMTPEQRRERALKASKAGVAARAKKKADREAL